MTSKCYPKHRIALFPIHTQHTLMHYRYRMMMAEESPSASIAPSLEHPNLTYGQLVAPSAHEAHTLHPSTQTPPFEPQHYPPGIPRTSTAGQSNDGGYALQGTSEQIQPSPMN